MRKPYQLLFLLFGLLTLAMPIIALADEQLYDQDMASQKLNRLRTSKLRTSLSNDPDTIWIGHIQHSNYVPVDRNRSPVPSSARTASGFPSVAGTVPVGGFGPWHVGRGDYLPGIGPRNTLPSPNGQPPSYDGVWDFDNFQAGDDSLQGWWPAARPGQTEGAGNPDDKVRSFFGLDYGNQGNYVIPQGVKRTIGVTGYWHADGGSTQAAVAFDAAQHNPVTPTWAPLQGSKSAWCGLRSHGDVAVVDPVTGNGYTQDVLQFNGNNAFNQTGTHSANGTDKNFPGFGSQWDQFLYRDITLGGSDALNISFQYVHALSAISGGTANQRVGYFWKDPVKGATANDGNYISRTDCDGLSLPVPADSFTVFIGVPVDPIGNNLGTPNDFTDTNGNQRDIYDPQRRWFSEVIDLTQTKIELLAHCGWSKADGTTEAQTSAHAPASATFSANIPNAGNLASIIAAGNGKVRLVFRIKTNRGNDDEDNLNTSFTSFTRGAAIVDDVKLLANGTTVPTGFTNGDFEAAGSIDNTLHTVDGCTVNGSTTVTSAGKFGPVSVGDYAYGDNIPAGATVAAKANNSSLTLSAATVNGTSSTARVWFAPNSALEAWKSSGKPPKVFVHVHTVDAGGGLLWEDPCSGPSFSDPSAPNRQCNMIHDVLTGGDHDNGERPAGDYGSGTTSGDFNMRDQQKLAITPVIITATDQSDATKYNAMGLNKDIMANFTDWNIYSDIHTAGFAGTGGTGQGGARSIGLASYPATQPNGVKCWGEASFGLSVFFNSTATCGLQAFSLYSTGQVITSNVGGIPDSIRVYVQYFNRCYASSIPITRCAGGTPVQPTLMGQYMDNFAFEVEKGTPVAGLSHSPWMLGGDAFPQYVSNMSPMTMKTVFASQSFDTATALMKATINQSLPGGASRISVEGDTMQITTGVTPNIRVDLVFRIFPGPGNYVTIGTRASGTNVGRLRAVPTSAAPTAVSPASTSSNFFESYMADNGAFGTNGDGSAGPGHILMNGTHPPSAGFNDNPPTGAAGSVMGAATPGNPAVWDPNTWNSARCDTLEQNLWPDLAAGLNVANNTGGQDWQSSYHELDPKYTTLGIARNRCFLVNPAGAQTCASKAPTSTAQCNIICATGTGTGAFDNTFPPTWAPVGGGAGFNHETVGSGYGSDGIGTDYNYTVAGPYGQPAHNSGSTYEGTKIIPDGLLTAGSLVQYFYRRQPGTGSAVDLYPDTTQIFGGISSDGGRWYTISVLPDRWKDAAFASTGGIGTGMACMLVVDNQDRSGDEFFWKEAADSIGLTARTGGFLNQGKLGASDGYYAPGGTNSPGLFDLATLRRDNFGQQGSLYDLFSVRAGESITTAAGWISNRYAAQPLSTQLTDKKQSSTGVWDELLASGTVGYKSMVWLVGSVTSTFFGAVIERTDDDLLMMNRYAILNGPRSVFVWGAGFAENLGPVSGGTAWLNTFFGANLVNKAYRTFSGHASQVAHAWANPGGAFENASNKGYIDYGLSDGCGLESDVLSVYSPVTTAVANTWYENVGSGTATTDQKYVGSVYAPAGGTRIWTTLYDGGRDQRMGNFANVLPLGRQGYQYFVIKALAITSGALSCSPYASPVGVGDGPHTGAGSAFVNFLNLRSANPMHSGEARLAFGLAKTEKVELRVYDVTGRVVKTVANRIFAGGQEHTVIWDGTDEAGNRVRPGVFFYQLRTPTWTSQKKLAVLSN